MDRNNTTHNGGLLLRSSDARTAPTVSSDFVLRWGNRKRLRCMKVQAKDDGPTHHSNNAKSNGQRATARIDRRSDLNKDSSNYNTNGCKANGYINLRQRPPSPSQRILRNSDNSIGMRGHSNGVRGLTSPDKKSGATGHNIITHHHSKKNNTDGNDQNDHHRHTGGSGGSGSSETTHDGRKGGSSPGADTITTMWPPKFVIALTNKEKEEDFWAIKGSKLPQRPKKRAKIIQRTVNLVCPGTWLCDLTLERYEVREKKVSKKKPRGLKAMGNMESESE